MSSSLSMCRDEPPLQTMSAPNSPPKRPRLSLQIKAPPTPQVFGKSITALKTDFTNPFSPTAFNTLSNAYAVAIESRSPLNTNPPKPTLTTSRPTSLRLQTSTSSTSTPGTPGTQKDCSSPSPRLQTPGPFTNITPDSPNTAHPSTSPNTAKGSSTNTAFPFTFTPPQSAHPQDATDPKVFTFAPHISPKNSNMSPISPNTNALRRRNTIASLHSAPYTHPRSLRSILRNSPLPPRSNMTPASPRRMSIRYNPNKKVGYNTPLTQTITTNKYIHSHIDLLSEDASPFTPTDAEKEGVLEMVMGYTGDETRDGGRTPGPYEEMRRRMASLGDESNSPTSGSIPSSKKDSLRKRKRREKKRQWIWTIGDNDNDNEHDNDHDNDNNDDEEEGKQRSGGDRMELCHTPSSSMDSGTCSVSLPLTMTARPGVIDSLFPSREGSFSSDERDSETERGERYGSPHSI